MKCRVEYEDSFGYWREIELTSLSPYRAEPYAVIIGSVSLGFFDSVGSARSFAFSLSEQLHIVGFVASLFGVKPRPVRVRPISERIEIVDAPSFN